MGESISKLLLALLICGAAQHVSANDKFLFYINGSNLFGNDDNSKPMKNYQHIVGYLQNKGFDVVFDPRKEANVEGDARYIEQRINNKLESGVSPEQIFVAGYSYGSIVTLVSSGMLNNPNVNYVLLAS